MKKDNRFLLFILLFGTMLVFGMTENIRGVSYPLIREEFNASWEQMGLMVSMFQAAYVIFCIVAGIFLGRFGIKPSFLFGFAALCAGLVSVFFMPGFFPAAAALLVVFAGFGFFEIGINALASKLFVKKAALLMNLLHSFYGIGAMMGPKAAGLIAGSARFGWRYAYLFAAPLALVFCIPAVFTRFPEDSPQTGVHSATKSAAGTAGHKGFFDALRSPTVWLMSVTLGLAAAVEISSSNWGPLYFQDVYGLNPGTGAFLSAFFLAFTVSRLAGGFIVERIGYMRSLLGAACMVLAVYTAGFFLGARGIYVLPALGFFVALFWPTLMAVAFVSFGADAPVYSSAVIAIGGLLNAVIQFFIGYTNKILGPAWGYRSCVVYTALLIFLLLALYRKLKQYR